MSVNTNTIRANQALLVHTSEFNNLLNPFGQASDFSLRTNQRIRQSVSQGYTM